MPALEVTRRQNPCPERAHEIETTVCADPEPITTPSREPPRQVDRSSPLWAEKPSVKGRLSESEPTATMRIDGP